MGMGWEGLQNRRTGVKFNPYKKEGRGGGQLAVLAILRGVCAKCFHSFKGVSILMTIQPMVLYYKGCRVDRRPDRCRLILYQTVLF